MGVEMMVEFDEEIHAEIPYFRDLQDHYQGRTVRQMKNKMLYFAEYLKSERDRDNVLDADYTDVLAYFREKIEPKNILIKSKQRYRMVLNTYYAIVQERKNAAGKDFNSPVPSEFGFSFLDKKNRDKEFDQQYLTYPTIQRLLRFTFFTDYELFIQVCLLAYTGMRVSELVTIRVTDLDLESRIIITGRVSGHSKSGVVVYFYPTFFGRYFRDFIEQTDHKEFLFPSPVSNRDHISTKTPRSKLRKITEILDLDQPVNPHAFRDAINTGREEMGCRIETRNLLLNQKSKNVNTKHYLKKYKNLLKLREKYDRWFPYPEFTI